MARLAIIAATTAVAYAASGGNWATTAYAFSAAAMATAPSPSLDDGTRLSAEDRVLSNASYGAKIPIIYGMMVSEGVLIESDTEMDEASA